MKTNKTVLSKILPLFVAAMALAAMALPSQSVAGPFKGKAEGAIANSVPGPEGVALTVIAEGHASQVGKFYRQEVLLFDPAAGTIAGEIIFIAANGDQLFGTVSGGFISPTTATGSYTFTGGIGRFANARGSAEFILLTSDGINFTVEFLGTLSKGHSRKK